MATSNVMQISVGIAAITSIVGAVFPESSQALTLVSNRTALGANDAVDWSVVGRPFTDVANPLSVTSSSGLNLKVSRASGLFQRIDRGDAAWEGNFALGDALLFARRNNSGPLAIDFDVPVSGVGTQVQSAGGQGVGSSFNFPASIEAFDPLGNSLGSFSVTGTSTFGGLGDNTAIFVGVQSGSANIARLTLDGERVPGSGFAINRLDLVKGSNAPQSVPEPELSITMFVLGSFGAHCLLKRRQQLRSREWGVGSGELALPPWR